MGHTKQLDEQYVRYLKDESKRVGFAETIAFAKSEKEVIEILRESKIDQKPITIQGGLTGVAAGAVPLGGEVLNLSRMNNILGMTYSECEKTYCLRLEPGVLLNQVREQLSNKKFDTSGWSGESIKVYEHFKKNKETFFFPPDPTEATATIGGMVASDSSGAISYKYGSVRRYIEALNIILVDGEKISLKRHVNFAKKRHFEIITEGKKSLKGSLPSYEMVKVKNVAGYYIEDDMDLIDLFIGSEGTLGVITQIEIKMIPSPKEQTGIMIFWDCRKTMIDFLESIRTGDFAAIEYFDTGVLNLIRKANMEKRIKIKNIAPEHKYCLYVEIHKDSRAEMLSEIIGIKKLLEKYKPLQIETWVAMNSYQLKHFKEIRHIVPEMINEIIDRRKKKYANLTKLGTDMAVRQENLVECLDLYERDLVKNRLEFVIFGHIGNSHLHVNIIPKDMTEYVKGKRLYGNWASIISEKKGTISAEHGIGKIKVDFLMQMYGAHFIGEMRELKRLFDPEERLNRGNLFKDKTV